MVRFALRADMVSALGASEAVMALIQEDGTGLASATVYADAAYAAQFLTDRGTISEWQTFLTAGTALGAPITATRMLDSSYVWRGAILNPDQALGLPRVDFLDADFRLVTAAKQIAKAADATSLLALRLLQDPITANIASERFPDYAVTYDGAKRASYPEIDAILAGLFPAGGLSGKMRNVELVRWS
jgi:hypothetical protein